MVEVINTIAALWIPLWLKFEVGVWEGSNLSKPYFERDLYFTKQNESIFIFFIFVYFPTM